LTDGPLVKEDAEDAEAEAKQKKANAAKA